jgi:hypothetical protein
VTFRTVKPMCMSGLLVRPNTTYRPGVGAHLGPATLSPCQGQRPSPPKCSKLPHRPRCIVGESSAS